MNKNVYISYNHSGTSVGEVQKIVKMLNSTGLKTWFDAYEMNPGEVVTEKIKSALDNSSYVIAIVSPKDKYSQWVKKELELAIEKGKYIIPILINHAKLEDLPAPIANGLVIDISDNYDNIDEIYNTIYRNSSPWEKLKEYIINE